MKTLRLLAFLFVAIFACAILGGLATPLVVDLNENLGWVGGYSAILLSIIGIIFIWSLAVIAYWKIEKRFTEDDNDDDKA
ncbi:MAG: hypothetical protein AAGA96_06735 [Verrucomicrobiota bacterium]